MITECLKEKCAGSNLSTLISCFYESLWFDFMTDDEF